MKKRPKGTTSFYNDNKVEYQYIVPLKIQCVGGIMVSIAAFQAVDPGSIPGRRNFYGNYFDNFQGKKNCPCRDQDSNLGYCGHNAGS